MSDTKKKIVLCRRVTNTFEHNWQLRPNICSRPIEVKNSMNYCAECLEKTENLWPR